MKIIEIEAYVLDTGWDYAGASKAIVDAPSGRQIGFGSIRRRSTAIALPEAES